MKAQGITYDFVARDSNGCVVDRWTETNLVPDVGRDFIAEHGMTGANWYIGLFTANRYPIYQDTMATFIADCAETSNYTSGANSRIPLFGTLANGVYTNGSTPAVFSFTASTSIAGGFVTNGAVRNTTDGVLLSVERNETVRVMGAGYNLTVVASIPVNTH